MSSSGPVEPRADAPQPAERVLALLVERGLTIAVAESLTGGLLTAELVRPPGTSQALLGAVVAYSTELKHTLLGVDARLLAERGPVHPEVARQLATGVRRHLAVDGRPADVGVATTGVAGPEPQGGQPPGRVFVGIAVGESVEAVELELSGGRDAVRAGAVAGALAALERALLDAPVAAAD